MFKYGDISQFHGCGLRFSVLLSIQRGHSLQQVGIAGFNVALSQPDGLQHQVPNAIQT